MGKLVRSKGHGIELLGDHEMILVQLGSPVTP